MNEIQLIIYIIWIHFFSLNNLPKIYIYAIYQLQEILVDRSVHAAIGRSLSDDLGSRENEKPTLFRDDFLQAMQNFLPVAMRDITKPATEGGRSGWEDVGGLYDIRTAIKEVHLLCLWCRVQIQSPIIYLKYC